MLLLTLSLHAVPELFALFLPLAAWTIASRRKQWNELLAATFVTVAIAIPIILAAAAVETWVTPRLLAALRRSKPWLYFLKQATAKGPEWPTSST